MSDREFSLEIGGKFRIPRDAKIGDTFRLVGDARIVAVAERLRPAAPMGDSDTLERSFTLVLSDFRPFEEMHAIYEDAT